MDYLLETSTCSFLMAHVPYVTAHFDSLSDLNDYLFTCTIVRGEILFGIQQLPMEDVRYQVPLSEITEHGKFVQLFCQM